MGILLLVFILNQRNWKPLQHKETWQVVSNYSDRVAPAAIDQDLTTFWASHVPMTYGMFFQVDIRVPTLLNGIIFHGEQEQIGHPEEWVVKTSIDGQTWQTVTQDPPIRYRSMFMIPFAPVRARYVHVELTADSSRGARWMIHELDLLQPIIPWQVEQTELLIALCGGLWILAAVYLFSFPQDQRSPGSMFQNPWFFLPLLIVLLLVGWIVRVYQLDTAELTGQELQILSSADLGKYTHTEWLKGYFEYTQTGMSWLALLTIRSVYQLTENSVFAIRFVAALFGTVCILLLPLFQKKLFVNPKITFHRDLSWQALFLAGVSGLSLFTIIAGRSGEVSVITATFLLAYLGVSYRLIFQQGTYWWLALSFLLFVLGNSMHPVMGYGVFCILIASGIMVILSFVPTFSSYKKPFGRPLFRFAMLVLTALPVYVAWFLLIRWQGADFTRFISSPPFISDTDTVFVQIVRFYGFLGKVAWPVIGILIIAIVRSFLHKKWGMCFAAIQALAFVSLASFPSQPAANMAFLMSSLLIAFLLADGLDFLCSLTSGNIRQFIVVPALLILLGYIGVFSMNTLFWGASTYPLLPSVYAHIQQRREIDVLFHTITTDPDECKMIISREKLFTPWYSELYGIELYTPKFSELVRYANFGRFWKYFFVPTSQPHEDLQEFLSAYYEEIGRSSYMSLYRVRDEYYDDHPQRFTWRDLRFTTGKAVEDPTSSTAGARYAAKGEQRGFLSSGPTIRMCQPGWYIARFALRSSGDTTDIIALLDIKANRHQTLARRTLRGNDFQNPTTYHTFDLPFFLEIPANEPFKKIRIQLKVYFTGAADLWLDYIDLLPQGN